MKKILFIFLLAILVLTSCQSANQQPADTLVPSTVPITETVQESTEAQNLPRLELLDECFVTTPEDLGVEVDCGYVVVPEFYYGESNREIKLGFTRLNSGKGTAVSPLFKYAGGPGQANITTDSFALLQPDILGKILETRDIVFVEQRGTKYTDTFLSCPAYDAFSWTAYEQGLTEEETKKAQTEIFEKCINDFKAQGVNFDAYNSLENAADVNAVREALGYEKIIYYGASYGSQLGQHVMRDFPEILEAVVLDGASALSRKSWMEDRALDAQWAIDNLIHICDEQAGCKEAYDISTLLNEALALFDKGPLPYTYTDPNDPTLTVTGEITVNDFVDYIHGLQSTKFTVFALPNVLSQFNQGGAEIVQLFLGEDLGKKLIASRDAQEGSFASLMHFAVVCSDDPVRSVEDVKLDGVGEYAKIFGQGVAPEYVHFCELMNVKELPDSTDVNVTTDVPTLLLTGGLDLETPAYHSQLVADSLPNARLITFPGTTHVQISGANYCAAQVMTQFVLDPLSDLDLSCLNEDVILEIILPEDMQGESSSNQSGSEITGDFPQEIADQLDEYLQSQVYSDGGDPNGAAPGLVLLVDTPSGRYQNAVGVSGIEADTPMNVFDVLEIGSNSKSILVTVLMQLQEEGVLSLDDLLSKWLPAQAAKIPNGNEITLYQLANHTSGIWDYGDEIIGASADDPEKLEDAYTPEELVQYAIDNGTPDFPPGEGWNYSNTGYILLGMVAEKATGKTLAELFQERIFDPLSLQTAVLIAGVPQEGEITTQGYWWRKDGTRLNTTNWNVSQGWAAGAVAMSAEDLATYGESLAAGKLFKNPETLTQMLDFNQDAKSLVGGAYGLGLIDFGDGYWGHEGQTAGFQSLWFTNPEAQTTVVGLTNSAAYKAFLLLNIRNILDGSGLKPFTYLTLLPISLSSTWEWKTIEDSNGSKVIEPGTTIILGEDDSAGIKGIGCGIAFGAFKISSPNILAFTIDDKSTMTCTGEEPVVKLLSLLENEVSWYFQNGELIFELKDGEVLKFRTTGQS